MPERHRREHRPASERRDQLLDAAIDVMREGGIAAATTRAVTARAGLPTGAFHYCFGSKSELFTALLERELTGSLRHAWDAVAQAEDLESSLTAALMAYLDHVQCDPARQLLMLELTVSAARTDPLAHVPRWEHQQYAEHVAGLLNTWSRSRNVTWRTPAATLAEALVSAASGLASSWLASRDDSGVREAARLLAASLARGATER